MELYCIRRGARSRNPFVKSVMREGEGVYIMHPRRALKKLAKLAAGDDEYFFSVQYAHSDDAAPYRVRFESDAARLLLPLCGEIMSFAVKERNMELPLEEIFLMMDAPRAIEAAKILEEYATFFTIVSPVPAPHGAIDDFYADTGIAIRHIPTLPKRYRGAFAVVICEMSEYVSPLIRAPIIDLRHSPLPRESVFSKYNIAFEVPSEAWRLLTLWGGVAGVDALAFISKKYEIGTPRIKSYHTKTDDVYTLRPDERYKINRQR